MLACTFACLQARLKNPKNEALWLAAVRMEKQAGNDKAAEAGLAKALQVGLMRCIPFFPAKQRLMPAWFAFDVLTSL